MASDDKDADTIQLQRILERDSKSLALNALSRAVKHYLIRDQHQSKAYYVNIQKFGRNFTRYKQDIRLAGTQNMVDQILNDNPCNAPNDFPGAIVCKCSSDENARPYSWEEKVACVKKEQQEYYPALIP